MAEEQGQPPQYSNYPRYNAPWQGPGSGAVPPGPPTIRFGALSEAWELTRQDLGTWAVTWLLVFVISYAITLPASIIMAIVAPIREDASFNDILAMTSLQSGVSMLISALAYPVMAGAFWISLKRLRGERYSLADVFGGMKSFGPLVVVGFLSYLLMTIGFVLLLIPGMYVMGVTAFAPLIAIDQKVGGIEALRISYETLRKDGFSMFALLFVSLILGSLGACLCGFGIVLTMPIYSFALALHYHAYFPPQMAQPQPEAAVPA